MSFILDALKKAEAERQRQTGPTLLEVRVTPPRRRFPLWTLIIGALLGVNILLLLVFVLRRPAAPPAAAAPTAASAAATPAAGLAGPAATPAPSTAPITPTNGPVPVPSLQGESPADPAALSAAAAAAAAAVPAPVRSTTTYPSAVATSPTVSQGPAEMPSAPDVVARGGIDGGPGGDNPADYEPAVSANGSAAGGSSRAGDGATHAEPPSLSEIGGDLPNLRLDLHVYATRPADRYALINMHRVHEGDVLPEGPRVMAIKADGVELNYRGQEFMLHPQ